MIAVAPILDEDSSYGLVPGKIRKKAPLKTSLLAREMSRSVAKRKKDELDESNDLTRNDIIFTLIKTISDDKQTMRDESSKDRAWYEEMINRERDISNARIKEERDLSEAKFIKVFQSLEDLEQMRIKFKLYEKILGAVTIAMLYFILDKLF